MSNFIPTICRVCIHKKKCHNNPKKIFVPLTVPSECPLLKKKKAWSVS